MEKSIKKFFKTGCIAVLILIACIVWFLIWILSDRKFHVKTEYHDSFTAVTGFLDKGYEGVLRDDNSDFWTSLGDAFISKENVIPICDTEYFRCYQIKTSEDDFYICKFKPDGEFFTMWSISFMQSYFNDEAEVLEHIKKWYGEDELKDISPFFLSDTHITRTFLPYMNICYHDEMIAIAEKFVAKDFDGLDEYGLTNDMINDIPDLNEKFVIMNEYLQSQENN